MKNQLHTLPMFRFILCFVLGILPFSAQSQLPFLGTPTLENAPKHEVRAVWLTTIGGLDWPKSYNPQTQRQQLCDVLDKLKQANINTVLLQTRIRATTIYQSSLEPLDGCINGHPGKQPSYDPLAFAVEECHKRGMELHCWIVAIPIGRWNGFGCKQMRLSHPNLVKRIGDEGFMNPEQPGTADHIASVAAEIVSRYDVDGIHLDYIRYPETWKNISNPNQARANITRIVKCVHDRVKSIKRWVKISCSPIGKYDDLTRYSSNGWNAFSRVYQDVKEWLAKGYVDMLFPMMYFRGNNFYPFAIDWKEGSLDRPVVSGLGIYFLSPKEKDWSAEVITREMAFLRSEQLGYAFFRTQFLTDNTKGIYNYTANIHSPFPSLTPPMTWESSTLPPSPNSLEIKRSGSFINLTWKGDEGLMYNVYASSELPINFDTGEHLVATRMTKTSIDFKDKIAGNDALNNYYAVTSIDRYGNESAPVCSYNTDVDGFSKNVFQINRFFVDSNGLLSLTTILEGFDISKVAITDNFHRIIAKTKPDQNGRINVAHIDNGVYFVRLVNRKGKSHRIGYFVIGCNEK